MIEVDADRTQIRIEAILPRDLAAEVVALVLPYAT